ncbi:MAG: pimeloyl-ACP methyl ester carboxylesterase [Candidatus Binatia bacterium]|jgi:pimeloyl-ACP methyl ester carboxylesterase
MRRLRVGDQAVHSEAPEAGRYHAPILLLPGLFQSFLCWRAVTSVLAHRGWEIYCLARTMLDQDGEELITEDDGWERAQEKVVQIAGELGDKVIIFGADVGAALALSVADKTTPLALALMAPAHPQQLASSYRASQGLLGRLRPGTPGKPVAAPAALAKQAAFEQFVVDEPGRLLAELGDVPNLTGTSIPRIVYAPLNDPLVDTDASSAFGQEPGARLAPTRLDGRWWASDPGSVADEIHRFLILTLGDRIVEFPDEILED